MAKRSSPALPSAPLPVTEQPGWQVLANHLELSRKFSLIVLIAPDEQTLIQVRDEVQSLVPPGKIWHLVRYERDFPPSHLTEQLLQTRPTDQQAFLTWVSLPLPASSTSSTAIQRVQEALSYLNRHRNHLPKSLSGTLVIAGTPETHATLRKIAPDLWSIRSAFIPFHATAASSLAQIAAAPSSSDEWLAEQAAENRLSAYRRALLAAFRPYRELALDDFASMDHGVPDIWDLFIHPACSPNHLRPEDIDAAQQELPPRQPASDLLSLLAQDSHRRTVLLSDPGMGKSALIQALTAHLASGRPLVGAPALTGLLPVPLILRDLLPLLPQDQVESWSWDSLLDTFLAHYRREESAPLLTDAFRDHLPEFRQHLLTRSQVFFLIDGLDEIGDLAKRQQIVRCIHEGMRSTSPDARWLITSRIIGYDLAPVDTITGWTRADEADLTPKSASRPHPWASAQKKLQQDLILWHGLHTVVGEQTASASKPPALLLHDGLGFRHTFSIAQRLYLAPLDDQRRDAFTQRWFRLRHSTDLSRQLMREVRIDHHAGLRILSRVPNLLGLMCLLLRSGRPLPDGRAQLYDAIVHAYLGGIDSAYRLRPLHGHQSPIAAADRLLLLALIASHLQQRRAHGGNAALSGNVHASSEDLRQWLTPSIQAMQETGKAKSALPAAALLDDLLLHISRRSGLFIPVGTQASGGTLYAFAHSSFLDYFAAIWLGIEFDRQRARMLSQREATENGQNLPESQLDLSFPPSGLIQLHHRDFPQLPASPLWHESLIFLLESRPSDTPVLLRWLFPTLHAPAPPSAPPNQKSGIRNQESGIPLLPLPAVRLLTQLAADPEISISEQTRRSWWQLLWAAYLEWPHPHDHPYEAKRWPIAPLLLGQDKNRAEVLQSLVAVQPEHPASALYLNDCTRLTSADLQHLAGLYRLTSLHLTGCTGLQDIHFLSSLAGHSQLATLSLARCTGLVDLQPLSQLSQLRWLDLSGCTGLHGADSISPLSSCPQLTHLDLSGCFGLSQTDITAFHQSLPASRRKLTLVLSHPQELTSRDLRHDQHHSPDELLRNQVSRRHLLPPTTDLQAQLSAYARTLLERLSPVPLTQILNTGDSPHVSIQQVFTPLSIREVHSTHFRHLSHAKELADWDGREDLHSRPDELRQKKHELDDFLRSSPPVDAIQIIDIQNGANHILLGEAGGGKTLLSRHLATAWAQRYLTAPYQDGSDPIHIYIELKDYAQALEKGQVHDLSSYLRSPHYPFGPLHLKELGEYYLQGTLRLILDGLDEVLDPRLKRRIVAEIGGHECIQHQLILTSRIHDFDPSPFDQNDFWYIHRIDPLTPAEQAQFIQRYHTAFFQQEKERDFRIQRLQGKLRDFHRLAELAGTPLLLTLLCLVNRDPALPETRTELYEQAAELLLHNWDFFHFQHRSHEQRDQLPPLQKTEKHAIMRRLAWLLMMGKPGRHANDDGIPCEGQHLSANLFPTGIVQEALRDVLQELNKSNPENYVALLPQLLVERNSVLCPSTEGKHSFIHRTFLEFYAAWAWQEEEIPWNDPATAWADQLWPAAMPPQARFDALYRPHWQDSAWRVILILHCGRLKPSYAEKLLTHLLALADDLQAQAQQKWKAEEKTALQIQSQAALLLAAEACTETPQRGRMPALLSELQTRLRALATLSFSHEDPFDEPYQQNAQQRRAAVRHATQLPIEKDSVLPWLQQLSSDLKADDAAREASLQELAALWGSGDRLEDYLHHLLLQPETTHTYRNVLLRQIDAHFQQPGLDRALQLLRNLPDLQSLDLSGCSSLSSLSALLPLPALTHLWLNDCTGLQQGGWLEALAGCGKLKYLFLSGCSGLSSLGALPPLPALVQMSLAGCSGLQQGGGLEKLAPCGKLQILFLSGCSGLSSLSALPPLPALKELWLNDCTGLKHGGGLETLAGCGNLRFLSLSGCSGLSSLRALPLLPALEQLDLEGCSGLSRADVEALLQAFRQQRRPKERLPDIYGP